MLDSGFCWNVKMMNEGTVTRTNTLTICSSVMMGVSKPVVLPGADAGADAAAATFLSCFWMWARTAFSMAYAAKMKAEKLRIML